MRRTCFTSSALMIASLALLQAPALAQYTINDTQYRAVQLPSVAGIPYVFSGTPASADFNRDGRMDLAIPVQATSGTGNPYIGNSGFVVLLTNANGSFTQEPILLPASNPCVNTIACYPVQVTTGDFNGDGKPDIVFSENLNNTSSYPTSLALLYLGNGDGTFQTPVDISKYVGLSGNVAAADLRGSGHVDLVSVTPYPSSSIEVALGNGDGTFQTPVVLPPLYNPVESTTSYPDSFVIGDLGNGHLDIVAGIVDVAGAGYAVYVGNGDGTFQPPDVHADLIGADPENGIISAYQMVLGRFGPDHKVDMAMLIDVATSGPNYIFDEEFPGNGDGTFGSMISLATPNLPSGSYESVLGSQVAGDINHDGNDDLVFGVGSENFDVGGSGPIFLAWELGKGDTTFGPTSSILTTSLPGWPCQQSTSLAPALILTDLMGGGWPAAVGTLPGSNCLMIFSNAGTTTSLASSANPAAFPSAVTLTATVSGGVFKAGTLLPPPGIMSFYDSGKLIATRPIQGGISTLANLILSPGTHSLTASYSGDFSYLASTSAPLSQVVSGIPTAISLTSSANPVNHNSSVTFRATVSAPGGGKQPTSASGIGVYFYNGDKLIGARAVDASGTASITTKFMVGTHAITVKYLGDSYWAPSVSNLVTEQVN